MRRFLIVSAVSGVLVGVTYVLPYGVWAEINELPAHPLIVHGVVVLLPLTAIALLVGMFKRSLLEKAHIYIVGVLAIAAVGVLAAKSSGESLSAAVGLPDEHADYGNALVPVAIALVAAFVVFAFFSFHMPIKTLSVLGSAAVSIVAVAAIGLTYLVGHSGAESVWKARYAQAKEPLAPTLQQISLAEVRQHNTQADCWTIVGDAVYDVTSFVSRHPAGSSEIKEMCGTNASEDFLDEHSGQREPEMWLETLKIGTLKP